MSRVDLKVSFRMELKVKVIEVRPGLFKAEMESGEWSQGHTPEEAVARFRDEYGDQLSVMAGEEVEIKSL